MSSVTIPPKDRDEWKQIVTGKILHNYSNYVLQVKVHQACKDVASNEVSINDAIDGLYLICSKYALAVQSDFRIIFKTW